MLGQPFSSAIYISPGGVSPIGHNDRYISSFFFFRIFECKKLQPMFLFRKQIRNIHWKFSTMSVTT